MDTRAKRYRMVRSLGRGGMAEVYEAVAEGEHGFSRRVAIKRMLPELCGEPEAERAFVDEARIASRLYHRSIVSVLDVGTADGRPFQVLEIVDGVNLEQLARQIEQQHLAFPVPLACHVVAEVARALHYAHTATDSSGRPAGIVHRDVTPTNILVARDGAVKLTDFGIATARDRLHRTVGAAVKGTIAYMAPEQARGLSVDARADLFALGCVLHRLLVGTSPFDGVSLAARILGEAVVAISPRTPEPVRPLLERMLAEDPNARPADGESVAAALDDILGALGGGDPRAALRDRVCSVQVPQTRRGALDALFDVALVFAETGPADVVRTFTVKARERAEPGRAAPERGNDVPKRPSSWWRVGIGIASVSALLVVGAFGARKRPAPAVQLALPSTDRWEERGPAALPNVSAAPSQREPAAAERSVEPPRSRSVRVGARTAVPEHNVPPAGSGAAPGASGFIAIGGAGAQRAEIIVDGASRGYAPKRLELATGAHTLVVQDSGGRPLASERIELSAAHTASRPLVVRIP